MHGNVNEAERDRAISTMTCIEEAEGTHATGGDASLHKECSVVDGELYLNDNGPGRDAAHENVNEDLQNPNRKDSQSSAGSE